VDLDADLEDEVNTFTPDKITKRMLWRVALFKLPMRNMKQESCKEAGWD
jgi:hypothetical protein